MHSDSELLSQNTSSLSVLNNIPQELQVLENTSIPIHQLINNRLRRGRSFYAIEVSPNMVKSAELDFNTFRQRIGLPLFTSVTWMAPANVHTEPIANAPALSLARSIRTGSVLTHLTCGDLTLDRLDQILSTDGVTNVLALRGDYVSPTQTLSHAVQLVRAIKLRRPSMCVAVGAYPECHPDSQNRTSDLQHLADKCAVGVDFIITQMCFSSVAILEFIAKCRSMGIVVPVVVGIFAPTTFQSMVAMCRVCRVRVPDDTFAEFRRLKEEPEQFRLLSVNHTRSLMRDVMQNGSIGFQFFTLNRFEVLLECLDGLHLGIDFASD